MTGDKGRIIKKGLNNKLVKKWAFVDDGIERNRKMMNMDAGTTYSVVCIKFKPEKLKLLFNFWINHHISRTGLSLMNENEMVNGNKWLKMYVQKEGQKGDLFQIKNY